MRDLIFNFKGSLYAVHNGAIYSWHGTESAGYVSNIPRAHVAMHKGLKAYGMGRALDADEYSAFSEAINQYKLTKGA